MPCALRLPRGEVDGGPPRRIVVDPDDDSLPGVAELLGHGDHGTARAGGEPECLGAVDLAVDESGLVRADDDEGRVAGELGQLEHRGADEHLGGQVDLRCHPGGEGGLVGREHGGVLPDLVARLGGRMRGELADVHEGDALPGASRPGQCPVHRRTARTRSVDPDDNP